MFENPFCHESLKLTRQWGQISYMYIALKYVLFLPHSVLGLLMLEM